MSTDVRARIRFPAGGMSSSSSAPIEVTAGIKDSEFSADSFPCKEWCVIDDMMNISDSASVVVANINGENNGKFSIGQRVEIEESDPAVANGQWIRHFTGIITTKRTGVDKDGGGTITLGMMDLGWCLTQSAALPLLQIKNKPFNKLLELLIHPSWGINGVDATNDLNKRIKHGRQVIVQNHKPVLGAVLPFIQVEPGQKPFEIISTYAARDGVLVNMSADGKLVFFRPHYDDQALYSAIVHKIGTSAEYRGNVKGRPELSESIDGLYSETQCWSTVVIPPEIVNTENPNEMYRHNSYAVPVNPLPFFRREVFSDSEAISEDLRKNRAIWRNQMGMFNSWTYEVEFAGHSQKPEDCGAGAFFVSDTMINVDDELNDVSGVYYVQSVRRSYTIKDGLVSKLTIRKPGLLNPELAALPDSLGGGAKKAASRKKPTP